MINKHKNRNVIDALLVIWALAATFAHFNYKAESESNNKLLTDVGKQTIETRQQQLVLIDTLRKHHYIDTIIVSGKRLKDTTPLGKTIDTAVYRLQIALELKRKGKEVADMRDSLQNQKTLSGKLVSENKGLKEATKNLNLQVQDFDEKLSDLNAQSKNYDAKATFKILKGKGFRSDQNFVRFENTRDTTFTVNGGRFYDRFIPNTENNSVFGQIRASYNTNTGNFSIGPGIELKIHRFSGNVAWLWNPEQFNAHYSAVTIGGRFDVKRWRIP